MSASAAALGSAVATDMLGIAAKKSAAARHDADRWKAIVEAE
ncbi:hypothetical protein I553_0425 [Mycobacterium xenopi 4042]|uniref:Uncharacterized protein n=1 Tax=Mycobacterium xenopi 4042 TaxID=1299334 RepID=X7YJD3_MYCXE|nr:hypothetical protein I553_0425 [Mycobacterium xenopi 4042]EUA19284.1 hypothetical protein I552_9027 [Mycobacterium xenopi 3993]